MSQLHSGKRRPRSQRTDTIATHAGDDPHLFSGAASPAIVQTSTFIFESFEALEAAFAHPESHALYTRGNNPTVRVAEEKIAALEGAEECRLFGSGMAAIASAMLSAVRAGDHILSIKTVYGPAYQFMTSYLPRLGIEASFVDGTDPAEFEAALRPNTRLIYLESPSTYLFKLQDIKAVAELARSRGIRTIIDNSYATMLLQRPLEMGIDLCVYSATKYLNGHSDVVAGAVVGRMELMRPIAENEHQLLGGVIGPFEAWLIARGLRTLAVRMRQHQQSAARLVEYLHRHNRVRVVHYPDHPSHPQYELARRQMKGASGLLSFEIDTADTLKIRRFANALRYFGFGVSWGGHESLVFLPLIVANRLPPDRRPAPGLTRLYVGLEDVQDLIEDVDQALATL